MLGNDGIGVESRNTPVAEHVEVDDVSSTLAKLREMFDQADSNAPDGELSTEELSEALRLWYRHLGVSRSLARVNEEVCAAMQKFDIDKSGTLDWLEFLHMWQDGAGFFRFKQDPGLATRVLKRATANVESDSKQWIGVLQKQFDVADRDGSGFLNTEELTEVFRGTYRHMNVSRSTKCVAEEVRKALILFDTDKNGQLDWYEFVRMWAAGEPFKFRVESAVRHAALRQISEPVTKHAARVLDEVRGLYDAADTDGSGMLDRDEISEVLQVRYKQEGLCRPEAKVNEELDAVMLIHDEDGNGLIDFVEFTTMFCASAFKWRVDSRVRAEVLYLVQRLAHASREELIELHMELRKLQYEDEQTDEADEPCHRKPQATEIQLRVHKAVKAAFHRVQDQNWCEGHLVRRLVDLSSSWVAGDDMQAEEKSAEIVKEIQAIAGAPRRVDSSQWNALRVYITDNLVTWAQDLNSPAAVEKEVNRYERKAVGSPPPSPARASQRPEIVPPLRFGSIALNS